MYFKHSYKGLQYAEPLNGSIRRLLLFNQSNPEHRYPALHQYPLLAESSQKKSAPNHPKYTQSQDWQSKDTSLGAILCLPESSSYPPMDFLTTTCLPQPAKPGAYSLLPPNFFMPCLIL